MTAIAGLRVLVIEDEGPIALMLEDMLEEMGCVLAGSAASFEEARRYIEQGGFDFALLDLNLGGTDAWPLADGLVESGVPFVFASGYGRAGVPPHLKDWPVIQKPFTCEDLEKFLADSATGRMRAG